MRLRVAIAFAWLCAVSFSSIAAPCLGYEGPVSLTGKVVVKTFFGPPNYGENPETDALETQGILILAKPVCVDEDRSGHNEAEKGQSEVTLVPPRGVSLNKFAAKQVTVRGSLFHANSPHHRTSILMQVTRIEESRK